MPKVSIIVPFNNVETYIKECLDSLVNQTLKDIEIILVNDASTDKSREIAQEYANSDKRIKLFDINEKHGQGYARNRGIEQASGDYIGFVDADDFVETNMFEVLYNSASSNNTDISMCQVREYDDINQLYNLSDYYTLAVLFKFGNSIFSAEDTKDNILDINVALWNKIYKREYLNSINAKFPEGFIYEDMPFFFLSYLPAKRIQIVWENLYCYRVNRKNSTMQQFNNKILDRPPMVSLTYEITKKFPYLDDMKKKIQGWVIDDLFHRYTLLKEDFHKEYFFLMKKIFQNLDISDVNDEYWKKVYHFQGYLLVINNNFDKFTQKVFNQYLDIHEVENRLRSEVRDAQNLDWHYQLLKEDYNRAEAKLSTYDKFKILEEVFNEKNVIVCDNFKKEISHQSNQIYDYIDSVKTEMYKISDKAYELYETNKNDMLHIMNEIYSYSNTEMSKLFNEIRNNYTVLNSIINQKVYELRQEKDGIYSEISLVNEKISTKANQAEISNISDSYHSELESVKAMYKQDVSVLQKEFDEKLNNQRIKYENKLMTMETELYLIRNELAKVKRSFFTKVINKLKKIIKR